MSDVVLLDGGMGQELVRRSSRPLESLWSAMVLMHEPHLVGELHEEFITAGARVITVNAYACTRNRLDRHGHGEQFELLQMRACDIANEARERSGVGEVRIAGCLSPLDFSYRPQPDEQFAAMRDAYEEIVEMQAPDVDLFLCETMSSAMEARAAVEAAIESGLPVWIAWTLEDKPTGLLRSGETIAQAAAALEGLEIDSLLLNCSPPECVDAALPDLAACGRPFGAYANGFEPIPASYVAGATVAELTTRTDLGPAAYADRAMGWVAGGARIVGGCCEISPAHIAELAGRLRGAGHEITGAF